MTGEHKGGDHGSVERDASEIIAEHLARTRYEDLPANVVGLVKASILDTLACVISGTASEDVAQITGLVKHWGGPQTCTIIAGGGLRAGPMEAVLVNGSAIHQDDFDDCSDYAPSHPTSSTLVPALAVAEEIGGISGRDLILAVALGNDITCRASKAVIGKIFDHPWFRAPVCGLFGATAAAAKIYGATAAQHRHAFGLALPQVGGTWASMHHTDSCVRSIRDGLAYRNGVLAAAMAMRGLHGDPEVLDGPYGFYKAFYNGDYRRGDLVDDLGVHYESGRVSLKPWPSMRQLHSMITAVLEVMERHDLHFEQIKSVVMEVGKINATRCRPVTLGSVPDHRIDLLNNLPFAVAAAIRHRNVPLQLFHDGAMADDVILNSMPKVSWVQSARQDNDTSFEVGRSEITTEAGEVYKTECHIARGNPDNPMTVDQRVGKFMDCNAQAARPLPRDRAEAVIALIEGLEAVDDIGVLMKLLA